MMSIFFCHINLNPDPQNSKIFYVGENEKEMRDAGSRTFELTRY